VLPSNACKDRTKVRIAHVSGRPEAGDEVTLALVPSDVARDLEPPGP